MKLLLDTHIWLWYSLGDPQLSDNLRSTIASDTTELWLSPISIWEVLLLAEKGRISLQSDTTVWIDQSLQSLAICEAPLNRQIAVCEGRGERRSPLPLMKIIILIRKIEYFYLKTLAFSHYHQPLSPCDS